MFDIFGIKKKKELMRQKLVKEAEKHVEKIKENKGLPTITPSIFLDRGEHAFLEEDTSLRETRAVRKHSGGMTGAGFRVAKGVYIGKGIRSGTSESHQEWRTIDNGKLVITNKRMIFKGSKENRVIPLKKIISIETMFDGIEVALEARNKTIIFPVKNSYIWSVTMNIVKRTDNPLDLGDLDLNIDLQ